MTCSPKELREILSALQAAGVSLTLRQQEAPAIPDGTPPIDALSCCWLCPIEQATVRVLFDCRPERLTVYRLRDRVEERIGEPVGEGWLRAMLARMTSPTVAILDNVRPYGYQITPQFLRHLATTRDATSASVMQERDTPTG